MNISNFGCLPCQENTANLLLNLQMNRNETLLNKCFGKWIKWQNNKLTDYFWSAVWSDEQMTTRNSQNSRCALPTSPPPCPPIASFYNYTWWWLKTDWRQTFINWWRSSVGDVRWSKLVDGCLAKTQTRQNTNVKIMQPVGGFLPFCCDCSARS
jgi:hypothetical protein